MTLDLCAWGILSGHASALGRQTFYLEPGCAAAPTGRYLVVWDTDGDGDAAWWIGAGLGHNGEGWTVNRAQAREYTLRDEADHELRLARRCIGAYGHRRDRVTVQEVVS